MTRLGEDVERFRVAKRRRTPSPSIGRLWFRGRPIVPANGRSRPAGCESTSPVLAHCRGSIQAGSASTSATRWLLGRRRRMTLSPGPSTGFALQRRKMASLRGPVLGQRSALWAKSYNSAFAKQCRRSGGLRGAGGASAGLEPDWRRGHRAARLSDPDHTLSISGSAETERSIPSASIPEPGATADPPAGFSRSPASASADHRHCFRV
jgi:hypothetical protein